MWENKGGSDLGQLALLRAPDRDPGCPEPRAASANEPVGPRQCWPAALALVSTWRGASLKHSVVPAKSDPEPVQSLDSPRSPSETTNLFVSVAAKISLK